MIVLVLKKFLFVRVSQVSQVIVLLAGDLLSCRSSGIVVLALGPRVYGSEWIG